MVDEKNQPAAGMQAVLVPDKLRDRTDLYKIVNSDEAGHFTIRDVPPGDYKIFAWESIEPYSWFDPDVIKRYESRGKAVHVVESSRERIALTFIPEEQ